MDYEIAFNFLLLIVGIFILVRSGIYIVKALVNITHFLNVSEFTLSFILMAFATTLPEFGVGISSALSGQPMISLGNVFGSNILNLSFILGLIVLISGKLESNGEITAHRGWANFFFGISPIILLLDLELSRIDGLILIGLFFLQLVRIFKISEIIQHRRDFWKTFINHFNDREDKFGIKYFLKNIMIFSLASGFLLLSSSIIISSIEKISFKVGVSELLLSIFIVALGTSLPELFFGIKAILSKNYGLSLGNLYGASVFNSTWILGLTALIYPIKIIETNSYYFTAATMILVLFLANLFLWTFKKISRREGIVLLLIYLSFLIIQIIYFK